MRGLVGEVPFDRDMERQVHAGNAGGSRLQDAVMVFGSRKAEPRLSHGAFASACLTAGGLGL